MLVIELFKCISITMILLKFGNVFDYSWATALLPIWPLFYIYFGMTILLSCNFLLKLTTVCCSKFEKEECKSLLPNNNF